MLVGKVSQGRWMSLKDRRLWLAIALLLGSALDSRAQQAVVTQPGQANSGEASGTIASSTLFQQIWPSSANPASSGSLGHRNGCLVLNNSPDQQWVYFQGPGMTTPTSANFAAIKAESIPLEPAQSANLLGGDVSCATGGGQILQDAIWIAGTISDTYVAKQQ